MNTTQISCTLKDVRSFLEVFPSDILPRSVTQTGTVIINTDPNTEKRSHWLAVHFFQNHLALITLIHTVSYRSSRHRGLHTT